MLRIPDFLPDENAATAGRDYPIGRYRLSTVYFLYGGSVCLRNAALEDVCISGTNRGLLQIRSVRTKVQYMGRLYR